MSYNFPDKKTRWYVDELVYVLLKLNTISEDQYAFAIDIAWDRDREDSDDLN